MERNSTMEPIRRQLHQWKHPFDDHSFEAFLYGSWHPVEKMEIEYGRSTLHFTDNQHKVLVKNDSKILRIKSRRATLSDCSCFLRPGIDICVRLASQNIDTSDDVDQNPMWVDARIKSIKRNPHEPECKCEYDVSLYVNQGSFSTVVRTLSEEVRAVGLDQISILQKLECNSPCEGHPYRWELSKDCCAVPHTKLLAGKFLSDLAWLAVTSVVKEAAFCVRSLNNKIYYLLMRSAPASAMSSLNFEVNEHGIIPVVTEVNICETLMIEHDNGAAGLRRSYRRSVRPKRYLGCNENANELDVGNFQLRPCKIGKWVEEKELEPLATMPLVQEERVASGVELEKEILVYRRRRKGKEVMAGAAPSVQEERVNSGVALEKEIPAAPSVREERVAGGGELEKEILVYRRRRKGKLQSNKRWEASGVDDLDSEERWEGLNCGKLQSDKRYYSTSSSRARNHDEEQVRRDRTFGRIAYEQMMESYWKNRNTLPSEQGGNIKDQWKTAMELGQQNKVQTSLDEVEEEELSETDRLWREMEDALITDPLAEEMEGSNAAVNAETEENSTDMYRGCPHDFREDDAIGLYCRFCGYVKIDIKDMMPPFRKRAYVRYAEEKQSNGEGSERRVDEDVEDLNFFSRDVPRDEQIFVENEIWSLIPELRHRMHFHQKKAFEFLWRNIAGSMEPALMESESKRRGGCVISHSPGAGKTFLMIAFLASYLKLFPNSRPLVLAPKTTLYTWYKEFIKWDIPIPVYLIHARRNRRELEKTAVAIPGVKKPNADVKHALDCLEKIKRWQEEPSVLVMGYTSFLSLTRDDPKYAHRRYITKVLKESTGILIMDEGHNPRSTKSRLRKALMKVNTQLRILLSGTLFQNSFCEYFNTLCLARPKFVNEVLTELDPKYTKKGKAAEKARHLQEARARKIFLDNIAKKIDSNGAERVQGLNILKNMTNSFIDVYDNGNSDTLPGLQIYTLLMNPTDEQGKILKKLHKIMNECRGYPLEIELLVTLGSIHPWLVKTSTCAKKFFTKDQLNELEKLKSNLRKGSKVRFVLSLVHRVKKNEKVLIFCHNIAPAKLLVESFENCFRWKKGKEILVLNGKQELFERGKVIDQFEEDGGVSKVLIASISACAEGISLTAASRVIMLDSEWNPSKTKQAIARAFRHGQQKMVYVYQLLIKDSMEEDKYRRTTWKEWVSSMIFSEDFVEDPSQWQAEKIEDDILREMIEEDKSKSFHMIMKNEKASTN
ncbi:hypothetical protein RIF29_08793 [Crotalaria pallida]|uniref:SNF2 domain-containing protein CLASSY 1-like n=1 Tax=Crotalaria pallida TaxID=3830 RepID=A0AAN9FR53_CROPI